MAAGGASHGASSTAGSTSSSSLLLAPSSASTAGAMNGRVSAGSGSASGEGAGSSSTDAVGSSSTGAADFAYQSSELMSEVSLAGVATSISGSGESAGAVRFRVRVSSKTGVCDFGLGFEAVAVRLRFGVRSDRCRGDGCFGGAGVRVEGVDERRRFRRGDGGAATGGKRARSAARARACPPEPRRGASSVASVPAVRVPWIRTRRV